MNVKGAGRSYSGDDAFAQHDNGNVIFHAWLRSGDGQAVAVRAPLLTTKQAKAWVMQRVKAFHENPGARESTDMAVQRKVIMAHGQPFVNTLMKTLDDHGKMEVEMMVSPDAHSGLANTEDLKGKRIANVRVMTDGAVSGLKPMDLEQAGGSIDDHMQKGYEDDT